MEGALTRDLLWVGPQPLDEVLLAEQDPAALRLRVSPERQRAHARQPPDRAQRLHRHRGRVEVCARWVQGLGLIT